VAIVNLRIAMLMALVGAGCAPANLTPEQKAMHEIFVEVAYQCETRFHTIHVDQVDLDGGLTIHADADSRTEYRPFVACYSDALEARAEARRKAGQPVPDALLREPDVELD
jgi:hypothetical protein